MNAEVSTWTQSPVPAEISQVDPALHVLERMVRDPSIAVDRIERIMALIDSREATAAKRAYAQAMALAQEEMQPIAKDCSNPQTRSRYASLAAVDRAIRPIYSKYGLFPSFDTAPSEKGAEWVKVLCEVAHRGGHSHEYTLEMPSDGKGAKGGDVMTKTHATASAVTYGRRYLLMMIFNLATEDDDGNRAGNGNGHTNGNGNGAKLSPAQLEELRGYLQISSDPARAEINLCRSKLRIRSLEDAYASRFDDIKKIIVAWEAAMKKQKAVQS
jgi:ERF superfamily protein